MEPAHPIEDVEHVEYEQTLAAAAAVRRLGHALGGRVVDGALSARVAKLLNELAVQAESAPRREKQVERASMLAVLLAGESPELIADGAVIDFDKYSIVGGPLNPFGLAARHHREGDEAVTTVCFGPAYEGPPGRVHGGAVALVVDEATATVLPMTGRFGFTGTVTSRLVAPAPLNVKVEFRSRIIREDGRKLFISCTGSGPDGPFVESDAVYIQVDPATVPWIAAAAAAAAASASESGLPTPA